MDVRLAEDHSGRLYVGLNGGGLLGYQAGQWTQYSQRDGLAGDAVWSLCVDKDDTVWIWNVWRRTELLRAWPVL